MMNSGKVHDELWKSTGSEMVKIALHHLNKKYLSDVQLPRIQYNLF